METAVCTLFEGNYHYGVGALTNSLYHHGFRGIIWAGYRGDLPPWAQHATEKEKDGYTEYQVAEGCYIRFVTLTTDYHFTNYKPDFMLKLWEEFCPNTDALFYFDPDIVIKCRWSYFEEWITYGVALCEDVNSPIPKTHPLRMKWKEFYGQYGLPLKSSIEIYVNGGFIGIKLSDKLFLENWQKVQNLMAPVIDGLCHANVKDRTFMFCKTDQDALNITLMLDEARTSVIGKEGMDIIHGGFTMSHAIGSGKPWVKQYSLDAAFRRQPPRLPDNEYWKYTQSPIKLYSSLEFLSKYIDLSFGKFLGRFIN